MAIVAKVISAVVDLKVAGAGIVTFVLLSVCELSMCFVLLN